MLGLIGKDVTDIAESGARLFTAAVDAFIADAKAKDYSTEEISALSIGIAARVMLDIITRTQEPEDVLDAVRKVSWLFPDAVEEAIDEIFADD